METRVAQVLSQPLHRCFEQQARRVPTAIAVRYRTRRLTFEAVNHAANSWARVLHRRGIGPGSMVGLCGARSPDSVIALLAILKAGAGYVPIDPSYPKDLIGHMVRTARLSTVLTTPGGGNPPRFGVDTVHL